MIARHSGHARVHGDGLHTLACGFDRESLGIPRRTHPPPPLGRPGRLARHIRIATILSHSEPPRHVGTPSAKPTCRRHLSRDHSASQRQVLATRETQSPGAPDTGSTRYLDVRLLSRQHDGDVRRTDITPSPIARFHRRHARLPFSGARPRISHEHSQVTRSRLVSDTAAMHNRAFTKSDIEVVAHARLTRSE